MRSFKLLHQISRSKFAKAGFAATSIVTLVLAFQNCSPGFVPGSSFSAASLASSEPELEAENKKAGEQLYKNNCASCHGQLEQSTKRDRSAFQIASSIQAISQMKTLSLTSDELSKISLALASTSYGVTKKYTCTSPLSRGRTNPGLRRMSTAEIKATLRSAVPYDIFNDEIVQQALSSLPADEVSNVKDYSSMPSQEVANVLLTIADRAMLILDSAPAKQSYLFGQCALSAPTSEACFELFLKNWSFGFFRRPLTSAESARLLALFKNAGSGVRGYQSVYFVLMQSPQMSFHIEEGQSSSGDRRRLTDYEIANRISYKTTGYPPDATLRAAAGRAGELQKIENVEAQVSRLVSLSSANAVSRVSSYFRFYSGIGDVPDPSPIVTSGRGIGTSAGLGGNMLRELDDYTQGIFWKQTGDFEDFMTSSDSYPRNESMRIILGTSAVVDSAKVVAQKSPTSFGFLHRPALLTNDGGRTNPILRGAHLRQRYLCDSIPEPPSDLVAQTVLDAGDIDAQSNRAKYEQLTNQAVCLGCHSQINPVGFSFEGFDQLGMPRSIETLYADSGQVKATYPLNTAVSNPKLDSGEQNGTAFTDSIALSRAISKGNKGRSCYARRTFEFMTSREISDSNDGCLLSEMEDAAKTGTLKDVFIKSIANEDIFWRKLESN